MAYEWQTVESAAVTLGVSTRTLARRISDGKIESRLENGRREVLVCLPDLEPMGEISDTASISDDASAGASEAHEATAAYEGICEAENDPEADFSELAAASTSSSSNALALTRNRLAMAEDRVRHAELTMSAFRQASEMADREVRRAKIGAMCAWGTVAILSAGVIAAVGYTTAKVSRSQCQAEFLQQRLTAVTDEMNHARESQANLHQQAEDSRIAAARAEGRLEAMSQEQAHLAAARIEAKTEASADAKASPKASSPTSQPTFLQKMASIWDSRDK